MLTPYDLGNFLVLEDCFKIKVNDLVAKAQKELKIELLRAQIEASGIAINLTTSKTKFNGERFWFACPNCKKRAGVLYKEPFNEIVGCRICLSLKYRKQRFKGMVETSI